MDSTPPSKSEPFEDAIDFAEIGRRLTRGIPQILGFAFLGLAVGVIAYFITAPFLAITTTTRVVFSFNGYEHGEYPDHSKFQPDDIRSPEVITEAIRRQRINDRDDVQSQIRAALTIEGIIPANVIRERDRLRATGQSVSPYLPDEYLLTLSLPRRFPLGPHQREQLLNEIVSTYREKFIRTYADLPLSFGNAFEALHGADYFEYELILGQEIQSILSYLNQQLDLAKTFRSPATNYTYNDLLKQTYLFSQIHLNETLGMIHINGLSQNRQTAMIKMDYYLRTLQDREQKALEEESVVKGLLEKTQARGQSYVLGVKTQAERNRSEVPLLDQGLIDSLLANDAYNFLVRKALAAGLEVKRIQAEKSVVEGRHKNMQEFVKTKPEDQTTLVAQTNKLLVELEKNYTTLIGNIRRTQGDFAHQQFADAIRSTMQSVTTGFYHDLVMASTIGFAVGVALGLGLSLLGVYYPRRAI